MIQDGYGVLRRVYVRPPRHEDAGAWGEFGWHAAPDTVAAAAEHDELRAILAASGADVLVGTTPVPGDPDAIYAYDPILPTDHGAIVLRPGKIGRRGEPDAVATDLAAAGLDPGHDHGSRRRRRWRSVLPGPDHAPGRARLPNRRGGGGQLREILAPYGIQVLTFDLPHFHGPAGCLHLLSFLSPLDADLVVGYPAMMPTRLVRLLDERGITIVEVPDEEFPTMGPNVLALGPRRALALDGNPVTAERMRAAGVEVQTYRGDEISRKGDGGPTCLTRPLARG